MIAQTGILPTDPRFIALSKNEPLLHWTAQCLQKSEIERFTSLARLLGVIWNRNQVQQMIKGKDSAVGPNEIFLPLAQAVNPELIDGLKKVFRVHDGTFIGGGEYQQAPGEEVVNLGDLPPEEFLEWANKATGAMRNIAQEFAKRERTVTIKEGTGADEDPRLRRIREQIAASKRFRG